jgi:hypothetical protein
MSITRTISVVKDHAGAWRWRRGGSCRRSDEAFSSREECSRYAAMVAAGSGAQLISDEEYTSLEDEPGYLESVYPWAF